MHDDELEKMEEKEEQLKMPFGKYAGQYIEDIPSSYLKWVAENIEEDTPSKKKTCEACDKEWLWREKNNCHIEDD